MPQDEDKLLEDFLQKLKDDDLEGDLPKYILEKTLNVLREKEMTEHLDAVEYERRATETVTVKEAFVLV